VQIEPVAIPEPRYHHPLELSLLEQLRGNGEELVRAYLAKNFANDVYFVGRDSAKRIFPEYKADPTGTNRYVDGAASAVADAARRTLLRQPIVGDRDQVVILTGSPASGKTGSAGPFVSNRVEIQHETIFTSQLRATELIEQVLESGRCPVVKLFYTDDPRINLQRMIARAKRIGRTVPIRDMAKMYVNVPEIVGRLHQRFGAKLELRVTNNSETLDLAVEHNRIERALYHVSRYTERAAMEAMNAELGKIQHEVPEDILEEAFYGG